MQAEDGNDMIDWDSEIQLDDGREAKVVYIDDDNHARVEFAGSWDRTEDFSNGRKGTWYYAPDGTFDGGDRERNFYIVNVARPEMYVPEDWS